MLTHTLNASKRSVNEPSAQVATPSTASAVYVQVNQKAPSSQKKPNRKLSSVVRCKVLAMFNKMKWLIDDTSLKPEELLRKCVEKVCHDMDGYNESAFKKDLAKRMSFLLNDRKFQRKCWDAEWSLFEVSQKCSWAKESVFQQIRDLGIDQVSGFETPDVVIYSLEELSNELKALGFGDDYFEENPYTAKFKQSHSEMNGPTL